MLLIPILLPFIGGIFVFRQRDEHARNRTVLTLCVLTAAAAAVLCVLPARELRLMTIQGSLYLALENDLLSKLFLVLISAVWLLAAVFALSLIHI